MEAAEKSHSATRSHLGLVAAAVGETHKSQANLLLSLPSSRRLSRSLTEGLARRTRGINATPIKSRQNVSKKATTMSTFIRHVMNGMFEAALLPPYFVGIKVCSKLP
jgi:hypothetical protein